MCRVGHHIGHVFATRWIGTSTMPESVNPGWWQYFLRIYRGCNQKIMEAGASPQNREIPSLYSCQTNIEELGLWRWKNVCIEYQADNAKATFLLFLLRIGLDFKRIDQILGEKFRIRVGMKTDQSFAKKLVDLGGNRVCGVNFAGSTCLSTSINVKHTQRPRYQNLSLILENSVVNAARLKCCFELWARYLYGCY